MEELEELIEELGVNLGGSDAEAKISTLQRLELCLQRWSGPHDGVDVAIDSESLQRLADLLKGALRTGNARVAHVALSCTLQYFALYGAYDTTSSSVKFKDEDLKYALQNVVVGQGIMRYLGDSKESITHLAEKVLLQAGKAAAESARSGVSSLSGDNSLALLDRIVKEQGFGSKSSKTRQQSLVYLTGLRSAFPNLPLRSWSPILVSLLEDQDSTVREAARESIVTIFTMASVSPAARADLKNELARQGVRKGTSDAVLRAVLGGANSSTTSGRARGSSLEGDADTSRDVASHRDPAHAGDNPKSLQKSPSNATIITTKPAARADRLLKRPKDLTNEAILANIEAQAAAAPPPPMADKDHTVQVEYIASLRDLEHEFSIMKPHFEGKETEHNWQPREKAIFKIRGMLLGDVHNIFRDSFTAELKGIAEGIIKAGFYQLVSLRTTLASTTCSLIIELAKALLSRLDPLFDTFFNALLKLGSLTKKTIAQQSQDAVTELIRNCSFHPKSIPVLSTSLEQKNIQGRQYTIGHLKLTIEVFAANNSHVFESHNLLPLIASAITKGLADANAVVRDTARSVYWAFSSVWPNNASVIMEGLDANNRKLLEKSDPKTKSTVAGRTGSNSVQSSGSRVSVRAMISQKRAQVSAANESKSDIRDAMSSSAGPRPSLYSSQGTSASPSARPSPAVHRRVSSMAPAPQDLNTLSYTPPHRSISSSSTNSRPRPSSLYVRSPSYSSLPQPQMLHTPSKSPTPTERPLSSSGSVSSRAGKSSTQGTPKKPEVGGVSSRRTSYIATKTPPSSNRNRLSISQLPATQAPSLSPALQPLPPSPTLVAMSNADYSAFDDGFTMDNISSTLPIHNDFSSDDESLSNHFAAIDNSRANNTVMLVGKGRSNVGEEDEEGHDMSRILDQLKLDDEMIDSRSPEGVGLEVEEAVRVRAEQAEQTAHRFLELTEPEDQTGFNLSMGGDSTEHTIVQHDADDSLDVADDVQELGTRSKTENGPTLSSLGEPLSQPGEVQHAVASAATPLLRRMQDLHLKNSPANGRPPSIVKTSKLEDSWWSTKANLSVSRATPFDASSSSLAAEISAAVAELDQGGSRSRDIYKLARLCVDVPYTDEGSKDEDVHKIAQEVWQENRLFNRILNAIIRTLKPEAQQETEQTEAALTLLRNLVKFQYDLFGGRELEVWEVLLELRSRNSKSTTAASEVINSVLVERAEPLFALSALRSTLSSFLSKHKAGSSTQQGVEEGVSYAWAMVLKSFATLFAELPGEVLEEELGKSKGLILAAMNNPNYPHLRQAAVSSVVKAHTVIQDDAYLFDILGGLTKSQINLCTYLFAKESKP